jgi:hypothetical protein
MNLVCSSWFLVFGFSLLEWAKLQTRNHKPETRNRCRLSTLYNTSAKQCWLRLQDPPVKLRRSFMFIAARGES